MKRIYLVRHAKSDHNHPNVSDFDRSLNKRGMEAAPMMGKRLKNKKLKPQLILSSPAKRARTTAHLLVAELGVDDNDIHEVPAIYNASLPTLLQIIQNIENHYDSVMLFGHNPGFTELAQYLGDQPIGHMPTCGVYVIEFNVDDWRAIAAGIGSCLLFDYPKKGV